MCPSNCARVSRQRRPEVWGESIPTPQRLTDRSVIEKSSAASHGRVLRQRGKDVMRQPAAKTDLPEFEERSRIRDSKSPTAATSAAQHLDIGAKGVAVFRK